MSAEQFAEYVEHIADRRLGQLDLPEQYGTDNPFPWMSTGGQAASVGRVGIRSVPTDSYITVGRPVTHPSAWETRGTRLNGGTFPRVTVRIHAVNGVVLCLFNL
jgi:hypothetical protein